MTAGPLSLTGAVDAIGGDHLDSCSDLALDGAGQVYVTGLSQSSNFPVVNPLPGSGAAAEGFRDAFVAKLDMGSVPPSLVYSTHLGGQDQDNGHRITADASGNAYVVGTTPSPDFPVLNPIRATVGRPPARARASTPPPLTAGTTGQSPSR